MPNALDDLGIQLLLFESPLRVIRVQEAVELGSLGSVPLVIDSREHLLLVVHDQIELAAEASSFEGDVPCVGIAVRAEIDRITGDDGHQAESALRTMFHFLPSPLRWRVMRAPGGGGRRGLRGWRPLGLRASRRFGLGRVWRLLCRACNRGSSSSSARAS